MGNGKPSRKRAENSQPLTLMTSRSVLYCATSYRRVPFFSLQKCSQRWLSEIASKSSVPKKTKKAITAGPVGGPKRGRPPKSKAYDLSEKKVEEGLAKVVGWDLPPLNLWRKHFPLEKSSLHRSVIRNPDTAAMLADAFVPEGSKDKIIIDACPGAVLLYSLSVVSVIEPQMAGPGQLTRALLKLPKERIQKIIVLESSKSYLKYLKVCLGGGKSTKKRKSLTWTLSCWKTWILV